MSRPAALAGAAGTKAERDAIAGRYFAHLRADALDDAGAFMAQHRGKRKPHHALAGDDVGVTDPDRGDAYEDFVIARRVELYPYAERRLVCRGVIGAMCG
jgi:hypothetical protein